MSINFQSNLISAKNDLLYKSGMDITKTTYKKAKRFSPIQDAC